MNCGECDIDFACAKGGVPCIRLAPPAAPAPVVPSASSLLTKMERLRHLTPMDVGDTWEDQYAEIVEAIELLAAPPAAPADEIAALRVKVAAMRELLLEALDACGHVLGSEWEEAARAALAARKVSHE